MELPFVRKGKKAEAAFWAVTPSGNWSKDCETGRNYAVMLATHMLAHRQRHLLGWVLSDMARVMSRRGVPLSGIEVGFLREIAGIVCGAEAAFRLAGSAAVN
ncbi:MAG: hypothetical protein K2Q10_06230 [Rhodospirillales bacterium]|nr:hypothetical protein [Rhodospirillales bacterium]